MVAIKIARSVSGSGFSVRFSHSSLSFSSMMVVKVCRTMVFARSRGQIPVTLLTLKGHGRHLNSPFFQLMSGFSSFNHGNPRMIFCFPNPVTSILMFFILPWMVTLRFTYWVILPHFFSVPSMFRAMRGSSKFSRGKPNLFA